MGRDRQRRIELELAGFELFEQHVERHDFRQRRRMTRLVRIDLVDGLVGIVVDHDGGIGRMIVGAMKGGERRASRLVGFASGALRILVQNGRMSSMRRMPRACARFQSPPAKVRIASKPTPARQCPGET